MLVKYDDVKAVFTSLLVIAVVATAMGPESGQDTVTVKVERSQLQSSTGIASLYRKIEYSAWLSCEVPPQPHDEFLSSSAERACQREAVARTVAAVNDSGLTAFHETRIASGANADQAHQRNRK